MLCLGKFLFRLFWPIFGQKYIACGDIIWFWAGFAILFQIVYVFLLFKLSLLFRNCQLKLVTEHFNLLKEKYKQKDFLE